MSLPPRAPARDGAPGHQRADAAATQDVALDAHHREVGGDRVGPGLIAGPDVQGADAERTQPAGQPSARLHRHLGRDGAVLFEADAAAVEQDGHVDAGVPVQVVRRSAEREDALVLQKELAFLGIEQAEAREVDLLLVDLHLGEVGVDGGVRNQVLRQRVLHVEPGLGVQLVRERRHRGTIRRHVRDGVRLDLEHAPPAVGRLDADHGRGLRDQHDAARDGQRHERRQLVLPAHLAGEAEPPHLRPPRTVAQGLEWNRRLERPPAGEPPRPHGPDGIPVRAVVPLVGDLPVHPAAERIDRQVDAVAAVVERVEHDVDVLVLADVEAVAAQLVGDPARLRRRVPAAAADVDVVAVERQPDFGLFRGGSALDGLDLHEVGHPGHVPVEGLVQRAVDVQRLGEADGADGHAAGGVAGEHGRRLRRRRPLDDDRQVGIDGSGGRLRGGGLRGRPRQRQRQRQPRAGRMPAPAVRAAACGTDAERQLPPGPCAGPSLAVASAARGRTPATRRRTAPAAPAPRNARRAPCT